ncbi:hypothetical protein FRB99_008254 [Tulasnella sp. 403]|nr:hypothetical protein FRB99_008254 [Tulasnella sp. 403]
MPGLKQITAATLAITSVLAVPWDHAARLSTHKRHLGANDAEFQTYHPTVTYETFEDGVHSLLSRAEGNMPVSTEDAAIDYLSGKLGVAKDQLEYKSGFKSDTATHVYVSQKLNGVAVANSVANVVFGKNGKIVAYGSSLQKPKQVSADSPKLKETDAIAAAEKHLGGKYNNWPVKKEYIFQDTDHATLAYVVQVQNDKSWFEAFVDANTGKVVNVINFVSEASYRVLPWNQQDPTWPTGFQVVKDPADKSASPNGWHQDQNGKYTTTQGNNVISYKGSKSTSSTTKQSADGLVFDYPWDPKQQPTVQKNLDAARTNAFYVANRYHDLLYKYGFTEKAFNFQNDNYGKGGKGNDAIEMYVQAPGSNNANFATPPDGQPGHCNMYLWTFTSPQRDGDVSNDVITHEFTHGLTNRMTGGGTGRCLSTTEAGGMGEGWSDTLSFWTEQNSTTVGDFVLGAWVYNNPKGIRSVPYSTNKAVDPYTYATVKTKGEVHDIGEIWATVLIEVYAALVEKHGFSGDFFNPDQSEGNIVFLHLLVDALPLQPCSPTFLTARDAIILADKNRYGGANKCTLWKASI